MKDSVVTIAAAFPLRLTFDEIKQFITVARFENLQLKLLDEVNENQICIYFDRPLTAKEKNDLCAVISKNLVQVVEGPEKPGYDPVSVAMQ